MSKKKIKNAVRELKMLSVDDLTPFQGGLKDLSDANYARLKKQIVDLDFSEAISVWEDGDKKYILNGHQRLKALQKMAAEGYEIPLIPVALIDAKDYKQAKKKVLALASQFGEMTAESLHQFMLESEIPFDELDTFRFPEVSMDSFADQLGAESEGEEDPKGLDKGEIEETENSLILVCATPQIQEEIFEEMKSREGVECKILE